MERREHVERRIQSAVRRNSTGVVVPVEHDAPIVDIGPGGEVGVVVFVLQKHKNRTNAVFFESDELAAGSLVVRYLVQSPTRVNGLSAEEVDAMFLGCSRGAEKLDAVIKKINALNKHDRYGVRVSRGARRSTKEANLWGTCEWPGAGAYYQRLAAMERAAELREQKRQAGRKRAWGDV